MKKWIIGVATAALLAGPTIAAAQTAAGVRAGARVANLETNHDAGSITDLVVGGYFGFGISNNLAVQIEAVYGTRGGEAFLLGDGAIDPDGAPAGVEMRYLEIPLLLRAGFPGERFLPSFFLGPYAGFLLDCEVQPGDGAARECDASGAAQQFSPRATDYGLVVGGALDVALGENTIFIDARYSLGLLSIEAGDDTMDARHGAFALSGGFAVPIGR